MKTYIILNELSVTAELMRSDDYNDRFAAEYMQVRIRMDRLQKMLDKWDKGELGFEPTCPRSTYDLQLSAMSVYAMILEARAKTEGIQFVQQ